MIESAFPILEVPDVNRALSFYREVLGAEVVYRFPEEGDPVYLSLRLGSSSLGLGLTDADTVTASVILWLYVDDVDAATDAVRSAGFTVSEEPIDQPWGERVSLVLDPFGFRVRLGAATSTSST
ncbi:VOC family protein [Glaciibacter flavus]|uniref:VOC family protein n=1 Tax=Orlajensenia flava TaxID=2565934 RepID=UPI003AFFAF74